MIPVKLRVCVNAEHTSRQLRERYYAQGLNSKGEPRNPNYKPRKRRTLKDKAKVSYINTLTGATRDAYLKKQRDYQRKAYHKKRAEQNGLLQNGATPILEAHPVQPDIHSDAAKAILMAASVIRAVATGFKVEGR